jgi:hypothetical protein
MAWHNVGLSVKHLAGALDRIGVHAPAKAA